MPITTAPHVLRAHRRGRWTAWSAAALQADVAALAAGWQALGVRAGDRVHAVGPLGAPFVLSLLALRSLGAQLHGGALPPGPLRHLLVDGAQALEALQAQRPGDLGCVVLAHDLPGATAGAAVALGSLLAQRPPVARPLGIGIDMDTDIEIGQGGPRVLAEFAPAWAPGLALLLHDWLSQGAVLHLPEPGGDAWADRRAVRPQQWWADGATLAEAATALAAQWPGAAQARPGWRRWRAGRVLGLHAGLRYVTDATLPTAARSMFAALGWVEAEQGAEQEAEAAHGQRAGFHPHGGAPHGTFAGGPA